jgi:hypothetical protein
MALPEMWEIEPFRSVGPIDSGDSFETLNSKFGKPKYVDDQYLSGAMEAGWDDLFSVGFLPDGRLLQMGTRERLAFRSVELGGTISRLEKRLAKQGLRFDPSDSQYSELFELREFGIRLFVPLGTQTVQSVAVVLLDAEIPPNTWKRPRATKEGNLALLAKMLAEEKAKEQAERH